VVFSGGVSIMEYGTGGPSAPNVEYIRGHDYGGGVGGLEYGVRSGAPAYNHYNSRGDVASQTDGSTTVTFAAGYDGFGAIMVGEGATQDRQKANTKEQDPTGLLNEGFRYRDPVIGTFITRDPIGFIDGPNMYTYVRQNPWTHFDPEGLELIYLDPTVKDVVSQMRKSDPRLNKMVADLEHSTHVHTVDKLTTSNAPSDVDPAKVKGLVQPRTGNSKEERNEINGKGVDTQIFISVNPKDYTGDGSTTAPDPRATAAHELQHARDYDRGEFPKEVDPDSYFGVLRLKIDPKNGLPFSEERAVATQNIWQEENGYKPRTKYAGKDVADYGSQNSPLNNTTVTKTNATPSPTPQTTPPVTSARAVSEKKSTNQQTSGQQ
jgi:RHS repeat-associated protein